jgi:hypothetical protein
MASLNSQLARTSVFTSNCHHGPRTRRQSRKSSQICSGVHRTQAPSEPIAKTISDHITKDNIKKAASVAQKLMGNRAVQEKKGRVLEVLGIGKKKVRW